MLEHIMINITPCPLFVTPRYLCTTLKAVGFCVRVTYRLLLIYSNFACAFWLILLQSFIGIAEDPVAAYDIKEVSSHTPTFILNQPITN